MLEDLCFQQLTQPTVWDEDRTKWAPAVRLAASSFQPCRLFDSRPVSVHLAAGGKGLVISPAKQFAYANVVLPKGARINCAYQMRVGRVAFTGPVVIPTLYAYREGRELWLPDDVWMSITPQEILTQRPGIRKAKGKCLVGGLGLGWFLSKVARKKSVQEVVLVEKSADLMDWFGYDLVEKLRHETGKKITVIVNDVLQELGRHGADTRYLLDVWNSYPNFFEYLPREWQAAIRPLKHFWGWGVFFSEPRELRHVFPKYW